MQEIFDIIVIGLGAMGSSALYQLSQKNLNVLGIDQYNPPHNNGSSVGESRIIREAYFEHPLYVPLVKRSYDLWYKLQEKSKENIIIETGGLMLGNLSSETVSGAELSAKTYNLEYDKFNYKQIKKLYNQFQPENETYAVYEKRAGVLFPEKCIEVYLTEAQKNNVKVIFDTKVLSWLQKENYISVLTHDKEYRSKKIIISAGAWIQELSNIEIPVKVSREILFWFKDDQNIFKNSPIYIWEYEKDKIFYGFPDLGSGVKVAFHHSYDFTNPDQLNRNVSDHEMQKISEVIKKYMNLSGEIIKSQVCMYTNTPDHHFIIDFHPENNNVIIASPCSGHGFKFSSVIGEILADMCLNIDVSNDIEPFKINRRFME